MPRPKKRLDPKTWLERAEQFEISSHALVENRSQAEFGVFGLPHVVLRAFGVEAYFKCLIELDGKAPTWTHNLEKLFDEMEPKHRRALSALWNAEYAPRMRAWNKQKPKSQLAPKRLPISLRGVLRACGDAFMLFRYGPEEGTAPFVLMNFPLLIRGYIFDLRPDLKPAHDPLGASQPKPQLVKLKHNNSLTVSSGWAILNSETPAFQMAIRKRGPNAKDGSPS